MDTPRILSVSKSIEERQADTLSVQFNYDDTHLAVGCSDGMVRVYSSSSGSNIRNLNCKATGDSPGVTSLRWRPSHGKTQNVLFATTGDGCISHWHATSGKILDSFQIPNVQVLCSDITPTGTAFAVGLNDMSVRIYDEVNKALISTFSPARGNRLGHSNRIFTVKWLEENCVVSGGWDNSIIFWDLRTGGPRGDVFGPHICGESIDFKDNLMITGSYAVKDQIQIWDIRNLQCLRTIALEEEEGNSKVYSVQVQKCGEKNVVVAGCTGVVQLVCYDLDNLMKIAEVRDSASVFCVDFCQNSRKVAAATTNRHINIYELPEQAVQ